MSRVLIDFSSPNIAKPFHFGHLKSTILGNYLANLNAFFGNEVTKINYLGDWGTQYGLLSLGLEEHDESKIDTSKQLLDIYVKANERAQQDPAYFEEAKKRFVRLDIEQDPILIERWKRIRELSKKELESSYNRLSIQFDEFEYESDYTRESKHLVELMRSKSLAQKLDGGVIVASVEKNDKQYQVPVLKSDGSSLYISRDVAAAISRKKRYNFDKMLYVAGANQEKHFHFLREIIRKMGLTWADNLVHVKMGKVTGMSSRSGQFILLSDIIDEVTARYVESTKSVATSKVTDTSEIESVGRQLALSALFVYDMRHPRTKNYEFDWKQLLKARDDRSGIHLQTTYARLCNLVRRAEGESLRPFESLDDVSDDAIACAEGDALVSELGNLEEALESSQRSLDACPLINYALELCRATNRARRCKELMVLRESEERRARGRLSLFESSRRHLEFIIRMLGLRPLERV